MTQMLIRSPKWSEPDREYTIDMTFHGVKYVASQSGYKGLTVTVYDDPSEFGPVADTDLWRPKFMSQIVVLTDLSRSDAETRAAPNFILASFFRILENDLRSDETAIDGLGKHAPLSATNCTRYSRCLFDAHGRHGPSDRADAPS